MNNEDMLIENIVYFKKFNDELMDLNVKYTEEIEQLKDKILTLENGIKRLDAMFYETFRISKNGYYSISKWELKFFTDKIQELKEVIKSEYRRFNEYV